MIFCNNTDCMGIEQCDKSGSVCGSCRRLVENSATIIGLQEERIRSEMAHDGVFCLRDVEPSERINSVCIPGFQETISSRQISHFQEVTRDFSIIEIPSDIYSMSDTCSEGTMFKCGWRTVMKTLGQQV
jgi:hypothetical protein